VRRAGIIYASSRGLTRRLKCQTRRDRGLARARGRLSFSPPPRDLNSGKTSRIGDRKTGDASAARDKENEERQGEAEVRGSGLEEDAGTRGDGEIRRAIAPSGIGVGGARLPRIHADSRTLTLAGNFRLIKLN